MKLTRKITLALVGGVLLIQTCVAVLRVRRQKELFDLDASREQAVLGRALSMSAHVIAETSGEEAAIALIDGVNLKDSHVTVRWIDLGPDAPAERAPQVSLAALQPLWRGERVIVERGEDVAAWYTYAPVALPDGRLAAIEVSDPLRVETAYLRTSIINAIISTGLLVGLCGVVAWLVGNLFVGVPVRALVGQARRIAAGDLSGRIKLRQRDELGDLAAEVNEMSDALEQARARVERETAAKFAALEQLKHVDRLRTVGTLASGIAHELGTPLNVVEGHAQLIRERPDRSEEVREHAQVIARQARRMTSIIRQLLDFARREQSATHAADVRAVAERVFEMAAPLAKKRNVELSCDGEDVRALLSPEELTQALVNVVINGVQAMPDGGALSASIRRAEATPPWSPDEKRDMIEIVVQDQGVGMDQETAERVFEPFFTTKDVGEGTGLGLSVAYGIIRERGGWIDVNSEPGRGSRFSLFVPAEERS